MFTDIQYWHRGALQYVIYNKIPHQRRLPYATAIEPLDRRPNNIWVRLDDRVPQCRKVHSETHRLVAFLDKITGAHGKLTE